MPETPATHQQAQAETRIMLRPLGSPMPLGFFAFGAGALVTAVWDLRWIPQSEFKAAALVMLGFVMPLELLACIFSFLARDGAGATAMGIFAATWAVFATFWLTIGPVQSPVLGVFTVMLIAAIVCLAVSAWKGKPLLAILLAIAGIRDVFLAAFHFGAESALKVVGWCGLILALFSVYGGLAFLLEEANQRTVIPLFRRGAAKESMEGALPQQVRNVEHEAGVRNQL